MAFRMNRIAPLSVVSVSALAITACGDSVENPPELSEIEESMWDAMEASESVTMTVDFEGLPDDAAGLDEIRQIYGEDVTTASIYGEIGSGATAMSFGDDPMLLVFDDEAYMSTDVMLLAMDQVADGPGGEEVADEFDQLRAELDGAWLDFSDDLGPDDDAMSLTTILSEAREGWFEGDDDDAPFDREELSQEGVYEERDGEDVWVYTDEGDAELVVTADAENPRMISTTADGVTMTLSDWDATEAPQPPASEEIIDEDELAEQMGMGW